MSALGDELHKLLSHVTKDSGIAKEDVEAFLATLEGQLTPFVTNLLGSILSAFKTDLEALLAGLKAEAPTVVKDVETDAGTVAEKTAAP